MSELAKNHGKGQIIRNGVILDTAVDVVKMTPHLSLRGLIRKALILGISVGFMNNAFSEDFYHYFNSINGGQCWTSSNKNTKSYNYENNVTVGNNAVAESPDNLLIEFKKNYDNLDYLNPRHSDVKSKKNIVKLVYLMSRGFGKDLATIKLPDPNNPRNKISAINLLKTFGIIRRKRDLVKMLVQFCKRFRVIINVVMN